MKRTQCIGVHFPGGIISPGYLLQLLQIAETCRVEEVKWSLRQELILHVPLKHLSQFQDGCIHQNIDWFVWKDKLPNITSSYVSTSIFSNDSWLTEGMYKDVFNMFDTSALTLNVNICDRKQTFAPLFTGHLNWVTSDNVHYWHLFIRLPGTDRLFMWPDEIYTNHIGMVTGAIENVLCMQMFDVADWNEVVKEIKQNVPYIGRAVDTVPTIPAFHLPYYEGFNRYTGGYWLGIYRRKEFFPIDFLQDLCKLCLDTKIGQLYATAWKSLVIKNIESEHRVLWDNILNKHRINVRHAANELNWQVEDNNEDALVLKRQIIRQFDIEDVRTYGLVFCIQLKKFRGMFGSVIIRKSNNPANGLKALDKFDLLHTKDFNPNEQQLILFRDNVPKIHLGTYLISLCKHYYETKNTAKQVELPTQSESTGAGAREKKIYQCPTCLSVYDEALGEPGQNIAAGVSFMELAEKYACFICDEPGKYFREVTCSVNGSV